MRVVLRASIFENLALSALGQLVGFGETGRHRIMVEDSEALAYRQARESWPESMREEWDGMLQKSLREDAHECSFHEILVTSRTGAAWSHALPELSLQEALAFLYCPFRLLLENGINDREFLLCACTDQEREWLRERIEREWIEAENGGGIDRLKERADQLGRNKSKSIRAAALFDGDDMEPGKVNAKSRACEQVCKKGDIYYHRLRKRSIENYLPRTALERWCKLAQRREHKIRLKKVKAFFQLSADEQAHFNMKEGLAKDEARPLKERPKKLYKNLGKHIRSSLNDGFGKDIQKLYANSGVKAVEFQKDQAHVELRAFIVGLIERIR